MRYPELEGEYHAANGSAALRATRFTDEQVAIAEAGFRRLERDEDLLTAIDHWLRTGRGVDEIHRPTFGLQFRKLRARAAKQTPETAPPVNMVPLPVQAAR